MLFGISFLLRREKWQRIRKRLFFVTLETGGSSPGGKWRASRETPGRRNERRSEIESSNPQVVVIEGSLLSQGNSISRVVSWPASSARPSGPPRLKPRESANDKFFMLRSKSEKRVPLLGIYRSNPCQACFARTSFLFLSYFFADSSSFFSCPSR